MTRDSVVGGGSTAPRAADSIVKEENECCILHAMQLSEFSLQLCVWKDAIAMLENSITSTKTGKYFITPTNNLQILYFILILKYYKFVLFSRTVEICRDSLLSSYINYKIA
jgi:hypothetical protein